MRQVGVYSCSRLNSSTAVNPPVSANLRVRRRRSRRFGQCHTSTVLDPEHGHGPGSDLVIDPGNPSPLGRESLHLLGQSGASDPPSAPSARLSRWSMSRKQHALHCSRSVHWHVRNHSRPNMTVRTSVSPVLVGRDGLGDVDLLCGRCGRLLLLFRA